MKLIKKKKLKGFTLLEVVVAIAVFAIAASLLVEAGLSVIYNVRSSRNLVKKVNYQSKIVATKPDATSDLVNPINSGSNTFEINLQSVSGGKSGKIEVKGYESKTETKTVKDESGSDVEVPAYDDVAGNLKYFVN